jgi:thioesterase DpgC
MERLSQEQGQALQAAGASPAAVKRFSCALDALRLAERPTGKSLAADARKARAVYAGGATLLAAWPAKPRRDAVQAAGAEIVHRLLRAVRNRFARIYVGPIYDRVSDGRRRFLRVDELVYAVAELCPGLCPSQKEVAADRGLLLAEKDGVEIAQGDFLSQVFARKDAGDHVLHAMLQPLPASQELLGKFRREGRLDLGTVHVERRGALGCVFFNNLRYLNAEDDTTVGPLETAVDLALLDPDIQAGLLRGNPVTNPKYRGRRVFSSGLNLTHLYQGKLSLLFFAIRDLGFVGKLYRGLAGDGYDPDGPEATLEKPWIAAVEGFAIGGGCQLLLVVDYMIAEEGSFFNLPARKEGIVPGAAPLRLPRFVGERAAREGILFDKTFTAESPEGRSLANEVVPAGKMDEAIARAAAAVTGGGVISAGANRKAIRMAHEPRDLFRQYMALYCREQVNCYFSPTLIQNLERNWRAAARPRE